MATTPGARRAAAMMPSAGHGERGAGRASRSQNVSSAPRRDTGEPTGRLDHRRIRRTSRWPAGAGDGRGRSCPRLPSIGEPERVVTGDARRCCRRGARSHRHARPSPGPKRAARRRCGRRGAGRRTTAGRPPRCTGSAAATRRRCRPARPWTVARGTRRCGRRRSTTDSTTQRHRGSARSVTRARGAAVSPMSHTVRSAVPKHTSIRRSSETAAFSMRSWAMNTGASSPGPATRQTRSGGSRSRSVSTSGSRRAAGAGDDDDGATGAVAAPSTIGSGDRWLGHHDRRIVVVVDEPSCTAEAGVDLGGQVPEAQRGVLAAGDGAIAEPAVRARWLIRCMPVPRRRTGRRSGLLRMQVVAGEAAACRRGEQPATIQRSGPAPRSARCSRARSTVGARRRPSPRRRSPRRSRRTRRADRRGSSPATRSTSRSCATAGA